MRKRDLGPAFLSSAPSFLTLILRLHITSNQGQRQQQQHERSEFAARDQQRRCKVRVVRQCGLELFPNPALGQPGEAILQPLEL